MPPVLAVLRRPRMIALGVVVLIFASACISLGAWQLRRLQERKDFNRTLLARTAEPLVAFDALPDDPDLVPYRRVTATGTYRPDDEVLIAGRSRNTLAGHELVTPLALADGSLLLVDRGWVPLDIDDPPVALAETPTGTVTVTGVLFPSQERGLFGPKHPRDGVLTRMHRVEVPRIAQQLDAEVAPWFLVLQDQDPAPGEYPKPIRLPELSEGPHRSYALQWFAFALTALVGYAALAIKESKRLASASLLESEATG